MTATPTTDSLRARAVLTPEGVVGPATVRWEHGHIVEVEPVDGPVEAVLVAPGFVDLQVNGVDDIDVAVADADALVDAGRLLARHGVTAWLPTLVSQPLHRYAERLHQVAEAMRAIPGGAVPLGAHLEGPFLGQRPGAHQVDAVIPIDRDFLASLPDTVRLMTLAPEIDGAHQAIRSLVARGIVVSIGHSAADAPVASASVEAGASMVTHLFNGMGTMHHRAPGIVGVALADDRLVAGMIADLVHVDPTLVRIAFRAKGQGGVALVSDSVGWRSGTLGHRSIAVTDGAPRLPDGTLAGSVLTLDVAVRNVVEACGVHPVDALRAASTTPATVIGAHDRGRIAPGARADLAILDADDLTVRRTVVGGVTAHEA